MTGSNTDNTTPAIVTSELVSSLPSEIEQIFQLLGHGVPDDVADQDVGTLLLQLERADSIGQNVEERVDGVLDRLDQLLSTLQHDEESQAVDVQGGETELQSVGKDPGR